MKTTLLKLLPNKKPGHKGRKRKFFAQVLSLFLLGNLFASHHQVTAAELSGAQYLKSQASKRIERKIEENKDQAEKEKIRSLWSAAAILARPLLFEHEDHALFQGKKKIGNFGVFWPKRMELPTDSAFRRYLTSEKRIVDYIVDELGAGPEQGLSLYQMAQIYSFVHNTTVNSGEKALRALKTGGFSASQSFMSKIDRIKGMKEPLPGLAQRRKDEIKLGKADLDAPISRKDKFGKHHTLASLQAHYNDFVSGLGGAKEEPELRAPRPVRDIRASQAPESNDPI